MANEWQQPGMILRGARNAKDLAVADVAHRTRIPARVIEALENDDYGMFSSPMYAKSFLSQYAEFLGVDAERWLDHFEPVAFVSPEDVLMIVEGPEPARHRHPVEDQPARNRTRGTGSTVMLILITGAMIYGGIRVWPLLDQKFGGSEAGEVHPTPPALAAPLREPAADPSPSNSPAVQMDHAMTAASHDDIAPPRAIIIPE